MIDIELAERTLRISFPYERELVNTVRNLPERRWDANSKAWFVPLQHLAYVLEQLEGHHFKLSVELRTYCESAGQSLAPSPPALSSVAGLATPVPADTYTVSKLNQAARAVLRDHFKDDLWIVGELQDYDKNAAGNQRTSFFDLAERPYAGASEIARIKAVMFEEDRRRIEATLAALPQSIRLRDGLAVRLKARVELYPQNGRYQLIVSDIDPSYTAGELEMNRERVFRALEARGIEGKNMARELAVCPLRVGLITSHESDAYNDFVHGLRLSGLGFELTTHHASVQGHNTEASVLEALDYFARRAAAFDVVAIVRGGGSRSDLAYFDTEAIGEAVCLHPVKVICGVGHQRDQCLLDFIAHSTKTPTAAAELLIARVGQFLAGAEAAVEHMGVRATAQVLAAQSLLLRESARLERSVNARLVDERASTAQLSARIAQGARRRIAKDSLRVEISGEQISARARACVERAEHEVRHGREQLDEARLFRLIGRRREGVEAAAARLGPQARMALARRSEELEHAAHNLRLLDPQRVLERGFAILRSRGKLVRSSEDVAMDQLLDVRLADGSISVKRVPDE